MSMNIPKGLENYGVERLMSAITNMREVCDDAERQIHSHDTDLARARSILHTFTWGWANAQSDIEACLYHVERWTNQE